MRRRTEKIEKKETKKKKDEKRRRRRIEKKDEKRRRRRIEKKKDCVCPKPTEIHDHPSNYNDSISRGFLRKKEDEKITLEGINYA